MSDSAGTSSDSAGTSSESAVTSSDTAATPWITAVDLSRSLGQEHPPTPEQARIIEAPLEPLLVVAGAGSGKTETMTARVVWLVANGMVDPEEVLGLTFTRKAAGELADRVTTRLSVLEESGLWSPPAVDAAGAQGLRAAPTVTTYHSYASRLVGEHALRLGYERDSRLLSEAAAWQLAHEAVTRYDGPMAQVPWVESTVTAMVMALAGELAEHLREPSEAETFLGDLLERWEAAAELAPKAPTASYRTLRDALASRALVLPIVRRYLDLKHERSVLDFSDQMALAARLAQRFPDIGSGERGRYRVVLLDEFQDTSEAQLVLMTSLFAPPGQRPSPVTAVGDPHQSIYAWRGASATTLAAFPERFAGAPVAPLSTSWRNAVDVLTAANAVATPLRQESAVPVEPLQPRPHAPQGQVWAARVGSAQREADLVAEWIDQRRQGGRLTAAVLCRKRSQFTAIVDALSARGIPSEVVGLGGLLVTKEVSDVVALLTVVADPVRGDRLMRLLTGPTCRLGAADLAGLAAWARERGPARARGRGVDLAHDSADELTIVDALDDLPDPGWRGRDEQAISEVGLARLHRLAQMVSHLRSLGGLSLPDLVVEAERALGVDIEVLARPGWSPGAARAHLDAFADVAAQYAASAERATLGGFVDWIEAAIEQERGLDRPVADPTPDAVQVLTAHAAKGLEWDVVAVPGLTEGTFPSHRTPATSDKDTGQWRMGEVSDTGWLHATEGGLPYPLRGDRDGLPHLDLADPDPAAVMRAVADFKSRSGAQVVTEERRLAYVALTRARQQMLLTSSVWGATGRRPRLPSRFLEDVLASGVAHRLEWAEMPEPGESNPAHDLDRAVVWPHIDPAPEGEVLRAARARWVEAGADPDLEEVLGSEGLDLQLRVLLRERAARRARPRVEVDLPAHLSTSALVQLARDPRAFAEELRRPMPQPPQAAGRRGTAFHTWIEEHYARAAIVDLLELPGSADDDREDGDLEEMRAHFLASPWADRTPLEVELSLETVIAGRAIRGRVDAVFADVERPAAEGGVIVVDWKTGRPPRGEEASVRALQLAAYRVAYARWREVPVERVRGAFFYAATGETVWPDLPSEAELASVLAGAD